MISRQLFLLFAFFLLPVSAFAVTGGEVQVATHGQDASERSSAYRTGMRWLLNNRPDAFESIDREQANAVLSNAENYVDAFEFIELPGQQALDAVPVTSKVREAGEATHLLSIQFSIVAIAEALAIDAAAETLEPQQPSVRELSSALLWMLIRDGNKDLIVSDASTPGVAARLRELAGAFGWAIDFPELDLTDLAFIGPDEISLASQADVAAEPVGLTLSPALLKASGRYSRELVLTGMAAKDAAGSWQLRLRRDFLRPDATIDQTFRAPLEVAGANLDRLLQQAMAWTANQAGPTATDLGNAGAGVADNSLSDSGATIYVAGIGGAVEYLRLMRIVGSLAEVEDSTALEIGQNSLVIAVSPRSALASISSTLQSRDWLRLASREQLQQQASVASGRQSLPLATGSSVVSESATTAANTEETAEQSDGGLQQSSVGVPRLPAADLFLQVVK